MSDDLINIDLLQPESRKLLADLQALSADLQVKTIRAALRAGAKPIAAAMKAAAPDDAGTAGTRLASAINITQAKTGTKVLTGAGGRSVSLNEGEVGIVVGPNKKVGGVNWGWLAHLMEHGTRPHTIDNSESLLVIAGRFTAGPVQHPGTRARHWMNKAYLSSKGKFESAFYTTLQKRMAKLDGR
jgi:HK97 gp10 family phage protein